MLFDVTEIEAGHLPLMQKGGLGDAYRSGTFGCVQLIAEAVQMRSWDDIASRVVVDLGIRMVNNCGAVGVQVLAGFWSPAGHHVRDIIECHQLIEYFRRVPSEAQTWIESEGKERYKLFGFGRVRQKLIEIRGPAPFDLQEGFGFYSNVGSHPSSQGLSWHLTEDGEVNIGPVIHKDRFRLFTADLWAHMTRATLEFVTAMDTLHPNEKPIRERYPFNYNVVTGSVWLLGKVTAADIRQYWK